jgi:predicted TIM-barrel fold metal-dependent hydrolase
MIVDCHVHVSACTPEHGEMSATLQRSLAFRFMRWRLKVKGYDGNAEKQIADRLRTTLNETHTLDAAVVLAFDGVYDLGGNLNPALTHLHVKNDYVIELAAGNPKVLFGASVNPYRKDAVEELERCVKAGAVLLKWLPVTQDFDPSNPKCFPVYEALAHYKLPLLCHTGGEKSLPVLDARVADPALLEPALERGVTVIAAHCGTRSGRDDPDYLPTFVRMAREYENLYGDTAALNLPTRSYAWDTLLNDPVVRGRLVHGSDWPIPAFPPVSQLAWGEAVSLFRDANWMRRDVRIKQKLGLGDDYWHRGATLLRMPSPSTAVRPGPAPHATA